MVRTVLYLLASIFLISVVRLIVGAMGRAFTEAGAPDTAKETEKGTEQPPQAGELKQCAVCGTYAPAESGPKVKGVVTFLCSDECARKYRA